MIYITGDKHGDFRQIGVFCDRVGNTKEDVLIQSIESKLRYQRWFCGHYHINKRVDNIHFIYEDFLALESREQK
jgi:hypothetical protein